MTKAAYLSIGLAAMLVTPATLSAQDNVAVDTAVKQSVLNQANTIVLRNKLVDAKATQQRGDIALAAKIYQDCVSTCRQIGSGIDAETAQAIAGLTATRMILARDAQSRGDLHGADIQVQQVLKADPKNQVAVAFQRRNQQALEELKGLTPDTATLERVPQIKAEKVDAGTLVQNGKFLYEAGKLDEAQAQLREALKLDPDSTAAYYYLNLIQQAKISREYAAHQVDTQTRMADVEKRWVLPNSSAALPVPNAYATNTLTFTGAGRQVIIAKLDKIHLDNVNLDGLPLSEVIRYLHEQSVLRDPDRKGINFLINPNADQSGPAIAASGTGLGLEGIGGGMAGGYGGGMGAQPGMNERPAIAGGAVDPATGLPIATPTTAANGGESLDVSTVTIKIPSLTDVRLAEVLEAICLVADHPIKYSILDFGVVFSAKGPETPTLFTREFKVDPNTFYSGLESVGALSFGSSSSQNGGGGGNQGGGGGGGGGNNGSQNTGAVVGIVNPFAGSANMRSTGNGQGGGGGGGGGQGQGANNPLNGGGGAQGGGGNMNSGGLNYVTQITLASQVSAAARAYFTALGVNLLNPVGKAVFFNDKSGILLVRATEQDLDMIDRAIQALNRVAPQVHIKARFIEVEQDDNKALGFDWYLGQFNMGGSDVVGTGGSSPSLTVPTSAANPLGAFPGNTTASLVPGTANDQLVTSGLRNSSMPTLGTITGIMTDPNFRVALKALEQRSGVENLGEPEATTTSGRQTQMRATSVVSVVTSLSFQQGTSTAPTTGNGTTQ
jgi:hypothetical protein